MGIYIFIMKISKNIFLIIIIISLLATTTVILFRVKFFKNSKIISPKDLEIKKEIKQKVSDDIKKDVVNKKGANLKHVKNVPKNNVNVNVLKQNNKRKLYSPSDNLYYD